MTITIADRTVLQHDIDHLRRMAERVRAIADSPANRECIRLWHRHDEHRGERPLILTETDGGLNMVMPDYQLTCREPWAQGQEWMLQSLLMHHEVIRDDFPIEPFVNVGWRLHIGSYGVEQQTTRPQTDGTRGAIHIDAALANLDADFHRLHPRSFSVDRDATLAEQAFLEEVYAGILGVRLRGNPWWTLGTTIIAINFIGLENLMLYMYDAPEGLHRLMAFLRDDHLAMLDWMEREGLLTLNNDNDYTGSGSRGYTRRLPQTDWTPDMPVRTRDLWALLESQETVGVGPDLYAEFIFPYERVIAERFGSIYYGCCEPVHTRWSVLRELPNLRRVSISPWCDESFMAEALGSQYVYSRKPNPSLVSTAVFDDDAIRADLHHTLRLTHAHGNTVEVVMKDVHTLHGEPDRLTRWVRLAREITDEIYG